jgi:transposase
MRKEPSADFGKRFTFDDDSEEIESISAGSALGMAMMKAIGIPEYIDDNTGWDRSQRVLSPGNALKAICGTMFTENLKRSLTGISSFYGYSPVDTLFGAKVDHQSLNDVSLGRAMDTVFGGDLELLYYNIASRAKAQYGIISKYYHLDGSNITVVRDPNREYGELDDDVPRPMLGHPKDGHTDRLQYNFECVADDNGLPVYFKTHDGNTTDNRMDTDALALMADFMSDNRIVAVADCKLVNEDTVNSLIWNNIPFVSKCPDNYAEKVRSFIVKEAMDKGFTPIGRIGRRNDAPEYGICDLDAVANGEKLRFIAYRESDIEHSLDYYRRKVGKDVNERLTKIAKKTFACEKDAVLETERHAKWLSERPYDVTFTPVCEMVKTKRKGRGRPRLGEEPPKDIEQWHLSYTAAFNGTRAKKMAEERDIRVIVTSLPRSDVTCEDVVDGTSGADVMRIYLQQWKIENIFGEMKSKLGADNVFFESPKREAVMLFSIATAVLVRRMMQLLVRREYGKGFGIPRDVTAYRMFCMIRNTSVRLDRDAGRVYLDGPAAEKRQLKAFLSILGIDPSDLIG